MTLLLAWAAITGLAFALADDPDPVRSVGLQSLVLLAVVAWVGRRPEVVRLLEALPRGTRRGVLLSLAALVLGQLAGRNVAMFPLTRWDMYGHRVAEDPHYFEMTGVTAAGREVRLDVVRELPSLNRRITTGLRALSDRIAAARDEDERRRLDATYAATVRSLAEQWTARHPEQALRAVRVWRITIPTAPFRGPDSLVRELYREVQVG